MSLAMLMLTLLVLVVVLTMILAVLVSLRLMAIILLLMLGYFILMLGYFVLMLGYFVLMLRPRYPYSPSPSHCSSFSCVRRWYFFPFEQTVLILAEQSIPSEPGGLYFLQEGVPARGHNNNFQDIENGDNSNSEHADEHQDVYQFVFVP